MSDQDKKQLNKDDDLRQVKSLIGGVTGEGFSLDDILSEYGSGKEKGRGAVPVAPEEEPESDPGPDLPWPEAPRRPRVTDNVVAFPGGTEPPEEEPEEPEFHDPDEPAVPEEFPGEDWQEEPRVELFPGEEPIPEEDALPFPEEESVLSAFIKDVGRRADQYADRMFEDDEATDPQEVRRLEQFLYELTEEQ